MDIQEIVAGIGSSPALQEAAGRAGISTDQAQSALQGVLEHVSSGSANEDMIGQVASRTGLDPAQVQQFLPSVMGLLQGHADNASEGVQATLSGLMGLLQASPVGRLLPGFDSEGGGSLADEALGMARGLFGGKSE